MLSNIKKFLKKKYDHREFLINLLPKRSIGLEIGVWKGDFSHKILKKVKPKKLFLCDPYLYYPEYKDAWYGGVAGSQDFMDQIFDEVKKRFQKERKKGVLEFKRMHSDILVKEFSNNFLDWIYVDGNHTYEYAKKDLELYLPKVKVGGYITGDDYTDGGWWQGGVKKAVDEFMNKYKENLELILIKNNQFILKKIIH